MAAAAGDPIVLHLEPVDLVQSFVIVQGAKAEHQRLAVVFGDAPVWIDADPRSGITKWA